MFTNDDVEIECKKLTFKNIGKIEEVLKRNLIKSVGEDFAHDPYVIILNIMKLEK